MYINTYDCCGDNKHTLLIRQAYTMPSYSQKLKQIAMELKIWWSLTLSMSTTTSMFSTYASSSSTSTTMLYDKLCFKFEIYFKFLLLKNGCFVGTGSYLYSIST